MDEGKDWIINYLTMFNAYIQSGVVFDDLNALIFSILTLKRQAGLRSILNFLPITSLTNQMTFLR